jgi:hypothetical protein
MPTREELEAEFERLGIDFGKPGFYDTAAFQRAEQRIIMLFRSTS